MEQENVERLFKEVSASNGEADDRSECNFCPCFVQRSWCKPKYVVEMVEGIVYYWRHDEKENKEKKIRRRGTKNTIEESDRKGKGPFGRKGRRAFRIRSWCISPQGGTSRGRVRRLAIHSLWWVQQESRNETTGRCGSQTYSGVGAGVKPKRKGACRSGSVIGSLKKVPSPPGGRGRRHVHQERQTIIGDIEEAVSAGARRVQACKVVGIDPRTIQRWRSQGGGDDLRKGPKMTPGNKLSDSERKRVLEIINSEDFRDLSPNQIVPMLADQGKYVASESTMYRILRAEGQQNHRETSREPRAKPNEHVATGPNQVWSWDITYCVSSVRGQYHYLYLMLDVWSRKIVGWRVHDQESMEHASDLVIRAALAENIDAGKIVLHSDNGSPMKGATMLATLNALGITASFSRPSVSNDNPYSESLFRTLKYRPEYPRRPFENIEEVTAWVSAFVAWYNEEHLHSNLCFVTPEQKHQGLDIQILTKRSAIYEAARQKNPEKWSGKIRSWKATDVTILNPDKSFRNKQELAA